MKKNIYTILLITALAFSAFTSFAQVPFYNITPGNGNGIRFWTDDTYKIHMGTGPEYFFGPVQDYSIKMNMGGGTASRGWTWGAAGQTPIAGLNTLGNFQIAGSFTAGGDIVLQSALGNKQIYTWSTGDMNWRIGMSATPGFIRSIATSHVQYLTYSNSPGQGFAVGANGGNSSFEITGSNHQAFFRGNVGLATPTPTETLDVNGTARIRTITQDNALTKLLATDANGKVFWRDASSLAGNVPYVSPNSSSMGIGTGALLSNTTGSSNTANGVNALARNTTGSANTANGVNSLYANTTGFQSTATGHNALYFNTTGSGNTANGSLGLYFNTTGSSNTANGSDALLFNTTGSYNTATGYQALFLNAIGGYNTASGYKALYKNTGEYNVANGASALHSNTTGGYNTADGFNSLYSNTTGGYNTASGINALYTNTTGNYNSAIGYGADVTDGTLSNATAIGASAKVSVSYGIVLGTASNLVGIRQNSPAYALHVQNAYCDGNTWFNASDKNLKENFARIKAEESVLAKVMELPIQYWNYKGTAEARHIGPTAQDFYKTFQLGGNERAIASVDEAGVALAAIQELAKKTQKLEALVNTQQELIASLLKSTLEKTAAEAPTKNGLSLYQNSPNPFTQETEIKMYIPEGVRQATLYVYDLNGKAVQQLAVPARGQAAVKLSGGALTAGIYLYTLVADDATTEVKRMILTE
jgi:trimeric autotransporter adhesin